MYGLGALITAVTTIHVLLVTARCGERIVTTSTTIAADWSAEFCGRLDAEFAALALNVEAAATTLAMLTEHGSERIPLVVDRWLQQIEIKRAAALRSAMCAQVGTRAQPFVAYRQLNPTLPSYWPNWFVRRAAVVVK